MRQVWRNVRDRSKADIDRGKIRLGIEAPRDVPIFRQELLPLKGADPAAPSAPALTKS